MANKQGTNQIVDAFIGDKLIEARYIGQTKYFDPYTTLTGALPLTFNSRVAGALKNYRLYGDSDGSGVQTENLFVEGEYSLDGHYLKSDGSTENNQYWSISEYISVSPNTKYTMYNCAGATPGFCWYDANKNYISGDNFNNRSAVTVTSPATAKYVRLSVCTTTYAYGTKNSDVFKLVIGSAYPSYKIPISLSAGYEYKEVHKDTVTINGIEWDILGYDHDTVYKSDNTLAQHSVTIQAHDCISELQFDAKEALFAFPEGLAAGTYHFTVSQQPWYAGDVGKIMQFTLANAIPADGVIVLGNWYNATMIGSTISVYASCSATTATETATISEGSDGTDLGSVGNAISGNTNSIQRALLGNNNYNESAIRQYLNSDGTAGTYWTPQNKWDRPPSWNASTAGFLQGFNSDFVSAIGKASKRTAKNTVSDGGGYIDTEEKIFLLSKTEVYAGANNSISEGTAYRYFSEFSDLFSAGTGADSNRIKYRNNVAKYWWLRSPYTGNAYDAIYMTPSGAVNGLSNGATSNFGVAPACCIILDDINANPYLQSLFLKPKNPNTSLPYISNYDLFIGDSKLYEDEYLDFGEQKVYKITPNNGVSARNPNPQFTIVNNGDGSYRVYHNTISSPYESIQVMPYISGVVHIECDITFNKITTNGFIIGLRNNSNNTFYPAGTGIFVKATGTYKIRKTIDTGDVEVYLSVCDLNSSAVPNQEYDYTISNIRLYVNPQDPPAPLPTIQTYQGENTLSSTETVGEVSVKGRISAISP